MIKVERDQNNRLVNDYDFDHDPTTDCLREIIRIFDSSRLRMVQQDIALVMDSPPHHI